MNPKNWLSLTVRVRDINLVAKRPKLVSELRKLTLSPTSGLSYDLTQMLREAGNREVKCKVLLAYRWTKLVGWAMLSREGTDFIFNKEGEFYRGKQGPLFQVYVAPEYRRQGIASALYLKASRSLGKETIHITPWDEAGFALYATFPGVNRKYL